MNRQWKTLLFILSVMVVVTACNMPGNGVVPEQTAAPVTSAPETQAAAEATLPPPTEAIVLPTNTVAPADVTFNIDCSQVDSSKQPRCETYINQTRDVVYPLYRELTGTSLSQCYDSVNYTIYPGETVAPGAGGQAIGNQVNYAEAYTIDLPYKYDTHELLHTFAACNGALDEHVFHGVLMNAVYSRQNVFEPGYFIARDNPAELNSVLVEMVKTSSGADLYNQCRGILGNHVTMGYFDLGEAPMIDIYKATFNASPVSAPNTTLASIWGPSAAKVQLVLEKLDGVKYPLDIPSCGY